MEHAHSIPRHPVSSTNLAQIGYDEPTHTLTTQFHDGSVYAYGGVPPQIHADLLAAKSMGQFHRNQIRSRFRAVKISS